MSTLFTPAIEGSNSELKGVFLWGLPKVPICRVHNNSTALAKDEQISFFIFVLLFVFQSRHYLIDSEGRTCQTVPKRKKKVFFLFLLLSPS